MAAEPRTAASPAADPSGTPETPGTGSRRSPFLRRLGTYWIHIALLILVLLFSLIAGDNFLAAQNFRNILYNASTILLLATGTTYLIIGGHLDLSIGSVLVFGSVVSAKVIVAVTGGPDGNVALGIAAGLVAGVASGAAWGLVNGLLTTRLRMPSFIVTLGTLGMALGLAQVITDGTNVSGVPLEIQSAIGARQVIGVPLPAIVAVVVAVVAGVFLAKTRFGRYTYATGSNEEAARRAGIGVDRHVVKLFLIMGALAGLAGFLDLARYSTTSISGHSADNLNAIAAVVIGGASLFGGTGTMAGTAVGVLIPAVLNNGLIIVGVQPFWQNVAVGAVLIIAVAVDQRKRRALESGR